MRERGERPQTPAAQPAAKASAEPKADAAPAPAKAPPSTPEAEPAPRQAQGEARSTAWDSTGGVSRAERSAAAMLDEPVQTDTGITLSVPKFYTMIAIALVLIVGAWAGGYRIGFNDGKDEMSQFVRDQPVVSPQSKNQDSTPSNNLTSRDSTTDQDGSTATQRPPAGADESRPIDAGRSPSDIMTSSGFRAEDPRTAGMNYLVLATLPPEQASDAISFMNQNGMTIIGVPQLDSRAGSANNPSRYTLYSLGLAIPGNRWSAMSNQRLEHQRQVATLGARWQRERRGGSDFSQTNWEKYEP